MRNNLIVWPILLVAGFLAGFIPQHSKANRLEQKVSASTAQIEACSSLNNCLSFAMQPR